MLLEQLLKSIPNSDIAGPADLDVTAITYDSRQAVPGSLFVAIKGFIKDGHDFAADAIRNGAKVIVAEERMALPPDVTLITVPSSRKALALLSAEFYGHPCKKMRLIGVTGTNGKTTTTHLIRAILKKGGHSVGLIGTVQNYVGDEARPVERTTPESLDLQCLLAEMADRGCSYVVMEVSSHALDLERVASCEFDVGVFTNLTQDHLDFHATLANYLQAKTRLFSGLGSSYRQPAKCGPKYAVINGDDPSAGSIRSASPVPVFSYGLGETDISAAGAEILGSGISYRMLCGQEEIGINLRLSGRFNVYNSLAAAAVGLKEGIPPELIRRALAEVQGVDGRLESVAEGQDFSVFVDYAHTPDGLENVLQTAQELAEGRIIVVFGCGGDRDRGKRPIMGQLAARYADYCIVTSDNPRSEEPEAIIDEIEAGVTQEDAGRGRYETIVDREKAIEKAISMARTGDVVLIAGKGHENYQIFKDKTIRFDDREVAHAKLRQRLASVNFVTGGSASENSADRGYQSCSGGQRHSGGNG